MSSFSFLHSCYVCFKRMYFRRWNFFSVLSIWAVSLTMTYSTAVSELPCAGAQETHSRSVAHVAIYCWATSHYIPWHTTAQETHDPVIHPIVPPLTPPVTPTSPPPLWQFIRPCNSTPLKPIFPIPAVISKWLHLLTWQQQEVSTDQMSPDQVD